MDIGQIKASFVNASRSQVAAVPPPPGMHEADWSNLDFLGWRDPRAPQRAYLVVPHGGRAVGMVLRAPGTARRRTGSALCSLCHAVHPGNEVELLVARRAGPAGRLDSTVGTYICADLGCPFYARGRRSPALPQAERPGPERVERLRQRVAAFVDRVLEPSDVGA